METLLVDRRDGIVTATLNRPEKKNAINGKMWRELIELFDQVQDDPDTRVLVITGAGDGFCSGADLTDTDNSENLAPGSAVVAPDAGRRPGAAVARAADPDDRGRQRASPPARLQPALGCDLVVASDRARFS